MKTREDFVSNSSSCSFFVGLHTQDDVDAFKKLASLISSRNFISMEIFDSLSDARDRWYGTPFSTSEDQLSNLRPGNYILCDSGEDHDTLFEERYHDMESLFVDGKHQFKLYADKEAHMTAYDDLPKDNCHDYDEFFKRNWD